MNSDNALQQLEELEPVPKPPPGPTYEHIVGNQIRWTAKVIRYSRYRRRKRSLKSWRSSSQEIPMVRIDSDDAEVVMLAAGWLGAVLGFWLR